ncbi:histone H2A deubiquitinase MYSM1 isoform X2 [Callorhinchus milii]|uniref:histone H2A deubiquitinase MYSM1 isoform X2 n=1 Tax=Callorhinchus milii TaxID=7868 RepID=UPI00045717C9|nr:histone H2A deubiquitinase MYSM1 isoform X2 [Callorhinchus milii]|eukprot:gi/632970874/ref/XP_007901889.1/ PREDICTED: histone H2A deubiquitinase MYSM1 isoform X2 [Callorhinchus milii]
MAAAAAEEVEVDIEGDGAELSQRNDNGTASDFRQNRYLDSSWRNDEGFLQSWTLDSSISEENRAAIEKMLQEEEYYLTGKNRSQNMWSDRPVKSIRQRKTLKGRTPVTSSAWPARWTPKEKELFEQGLAQFGRRWTKIAKLIESRTVLQVKSYARQYFKSKAKAEKSVEEGSISQTNIVCVSGNKASALKTGTGSCSSALSQGQTCSTVKIEHMSDDEDVDVMDGTDSDDDGLGERKERVCGADSKRVPAECGSHCCSVSRADELLTVPLASAVTVQEFSPTSEPEEVTKDCGLSGDNLEDVDHGTDGGELSPGKLSPADRVSDNCRKCEQPPEAAGEGSAAPGPDFLEFKSLEEKGGLRDNSLELAVCETEADENCEDEEDEEEEALKPPAQEVILDKNVITEDEKQAISEFFEGRPSKTPERFLKIRNYILDQWEKCKPKYLNKTSVRPGLKNCGDVNCIGRIHTYLELIGAINFGCEQAVYNRPRPVDRTRSKEEGKDCVQTYLLAQRLQSMRTRRRRVRDPWGNWRDAKDLEGQTFEHLTAEELASRREEEVNRSPRPARGPRQAKSSFDPFQLIPCHAFTEEKKEPFEVKVAAQVMLVMDMHAHVSMAEVIGLLGGRYSSGDRVLEICVAEPCNSLSTGLQCEMDPVSQTQASEALAGRGYCIVGWYHSHPAFDPNPSLRDIDTQAKYQNYFSRGGAQFVGMIISPYNSSNALPYSQITCLVVSEELSPDGCYRLPYQCELKEMNEEPPWVQIIDKARWIMEKYKLSLCNVPMLRIFRRDSNLTCLQKLLESMRKTLENRWNAAVVEEFLTQIEEVFLAGHREEDGNTGCEAVTAVLPPAIPE